MQLPAPLIVVFRLATVRVVLLPQFVDQILDCELVARDGKPLFGFAQAILQPIVSLALVLFSGGHANAPTAHHIRSPPHVSALIQTSITLHFCPPLRFDQRACAARLALSRRSSGVCALTLAFPPLLPRTAAIRRRSSLVAMSRYYAKRFA